jgi:hypothetical protein
MPDNFWGLLALASIPTIAVSVINWLLNRKRDDKRADVENEATAVETVTQVLDVLRAEVERERASAAQAREEAELALAQMRALTRELDRLNAALRAHRLWDDARVAEGAPPPPMLPDLDWHEALEGR